MFEPVTQACVFNIVLRVCQTRLAAPVVANIDATRTRYEIYDVAADLFDLTQGERDGRRFYDQITLFKNCGSAIEDLVAARLAYQRT